MLRLRNHINIEIVLLHDSRSCMTMYMLKPCDTFVASKEVLLCHMRTYTHLDSTTFTKSLNKNRMFDREGTNVQH